MCPGFSFGSVVETSYQVMPEGCSYEDTFNCEPYLHTSCYAAPSAECVAYCLDINPFTGEGMDCMEACTAYSCESFTTYHGSACTFTPGCEQTVEKTITHTQIFGATSCDAQCTGPFGVGGGGDGDELGSSGAKGDGGGEPLPDIDCEEFSTAVVGCSPIDFSYEFDDVACIEPGVTLEFENGDVVECDDVTAQTEGDYWCPENFEYDTDTGFCQRSTDICDQGFSGALESGCDTPYDPQNDTLWHSYQSQCVKQGTFLIPPANQYNSMCCYDAVFNGFEIYQWGTEETHIKVY